MPNHTKGRLKSGDSAIKPGERTCETADTPQLSRQNVKGTKIGNNSIPRFPNTGTHDVFTDCDAVEILNKVLQKKRW